MQSGIVRLSLTVLTLSLLGCGASPKADAQSVRKQLGDAKMLAERGKAYAEEGDYTRAEQYLSGALANGADPHELLPPLLHACVAAGHLRLATEYAETQLARDPNDSHLRFVAGALEASVGSRVDARKHLEQAAADLPKDAHVQFHVATFFRDDLNDKVSADPYFREYLKLAPKGEYADEARASLMERLH